MPGNRNVQESGGGAATPGGADTQVQFNDAGALGGDAGFTYNKATDTLTAGAFVGDGSGLTGLPSGTTNKVALLKADGTTAYHATLASANAVAAAYETIRVNAILDENNIDLVHNVTYDFTGGGLVYTGASTAPLFTTADSVTCRILGYGIFANRAASGNKALFYDFAASTITFTASYVEFGGNGTSAIQPWSGSGATFHLDILYAKGGHAGAYLLETGASITYIGRIGCLDTARLVKGSNNGNVLDLYVGRVTGAVVSLLNMTGVTTGRITFGQLSMTGGSGNLIIVSGGVDLGIRVLGECLQTGGVPTLSISNGKVRLGGRFKHTNANTNVVEKSGGTLILEDGSTFLTAGTGVPFNATTAQDVIVNGNSYSNVAADGDITIRLGTHTADATYVV